MKNKAFIVFCLCALFFVEAKAQEKELLNYPLDTINGEEVYRYQVEKSIGLFRIGVNFDVPQSEIVRFNPQLRERGLHYGETIFIPTGRKMGGKKEEVEVKAKKEEIVRPRHRFADMLKDTVIPEKKDTVIPTDTLAKDTLAVDTTVVDTVVPDLRPVMELALMLPFESHQTKRSGSAERMMEFYQGALLALHDLQNDSLRYLLRVYDTERSAIRIAELCDSTTELDSVRGILGLVYPIQIERMTEWCELHQVPLLLPFCDDAQLSGRPHLLQFNSTDAQEADSLCAWIKARDLNCVSIEVKDADVSSSIRTLRKRLAQNEIFARGLPVGDLLKDSVGIALDTAKENLIILHSDRYQQIRLLLPHLQRLQDQGYRIRLMSQYSWQKESISLPQVYTSMFTAETDREAYDILWRKCYVGDHVSEAPRYDLLGYDLMRALVAWINGEKEAKGLQSDIRWQQIENGGWQNELVRVIEK